MEKMKMKTKIKAGGREIEVWSNGDYDDYISLTDIARYKNTNEPKDVIKNWMRNRSVIEFLGLWERLHNPEFKGVEFDTFLYEAGSNAFTLSTKEWIQNTNAIGIISKSGRGGGTFAHRDIAFEFASWISPEFKLYIITDYQRLKMDENSRLSLNWNMNREISKINYRIHTDAIQEHLVVPDLPSQYKNYVYASEADVLNVVMFGQTAKTWKNQHKNQTGNIRDFASLQQLIILSNIECINAELIKRNMSRNERIELLNKIAKGQMESLQKQEIHRLENLK